MWILCLARHGPREEKESIIFNENVPTNQALISCLGRSVNTKTTPVEFHRSAFNVAMRLNMDGALYTEELWQNSVLKQ